VLKHLLIGLLTPLFAALLPTTSNAEVVHVAVAANFTAPMKQIAAAFEKHTQHEARVSFGSTGKFYAQISHGAPFDVFFSADQARPLQLIDDKLAEKSSRFTYALGSLVLWSADPALIKDGEQLLRAKSINRLAIANPRLATYGTAATQVLTSLKIYEQWKPKLVQGENIAQTYQFVSSGNAQAGFVALSQVAIEGQLSTGSAWIVPPHLYEPIRQDVVLLKKGEKNTAARALLSFVRSSESIDIIKSFGYAVTSNN